MSTSRRRGRRGIGTALLTGSLLFCGQAAAEAPIQADRTIDNPDGSKTFVRPRVLAGTTYLNIRRGVPGSCRLFGMEGFLSEYVVWSAHPTDAIGVRDDGSVGKNGQGLYIEEMTCIRGGPYLPKLSAGSIDRHSDGSVTVHAPRVLTGPASLPIVSGHVGACRLLSHDATVKESLRWSAKRAAGVSLALDGQIYDRTSGTYLTEMGCANEIEK